MMMPHPIPMFNPSIMPPQPVYQTDPNISFYNPIQNSVAESVLNTIDEDDKPEM